MLNIVLFGPPVAGKGTQCQKLVADLGLGHLSAGDLLRAEKESGSENGDLINSYIVEGKIVPVEITVKLLFPASQKGFSAGKRRFLVDGFPRNKDNLDGWDRVVGVKAVVEFCLQLETSEDIMLSRLLERGKSSGRSDDKLIRSERSDPWLIIS